MTEKSHPRVDRGKKRRGVVPLTPPAAASLDERLKTIILQNAINLRGVPLRATRLEDGSLSHGLTPSWQKSFLEDLGTTPEAARAEIEVIRREREDSSK